MGNEMGNSNVSGLQEEENRTVENAEKYVQEDGCADNVKEENYTVPAVEDKDFHEKVAGLASSEGNQTVPAVEDTNLHEKNAGLASGEGHQIVPAVEDTNFHEKITGLASGEGHEIVPAVEDTNFHEKITGLASGEEHQIVPAVEVTDFDEKLTRLPSDEENQTVPAIEDKGIHEKVTELASDDRRGAADPRIDHQTSDGIELDDSKVQPPPGSPQIVTESKDGNTESRIQPASLCADDDNDETLIKSNLELEDKLLETSEKQIERQISSEREVRSNANQQINSLLHTLHIDVPTTETEEEESRSSSCTNSSPNSPEHPGHLQPDFHLHELNKILADSSVENQSEPMQRSEEIPGLSQLDAEIVLHSQAESVGFDSNPDIEKKMEDMASREEQESHTSIIEERAEIRDGEEAPNGLSRTSSDSGNNRDEELPMEMNLIRTGSSGIQQETEANNGDEGLPMEMKLTLNRSLNLQPEVITLSDSLNSSQEAAEPEVKCVVLNEETELIRLELENQDDMYDLCPTQLCKESDSFHPRQEKDGKEGVMDDTSCSSAMDKDRRVLPYPNSISEELCSLSEMDILPTELIVIDCNHEGNEQPTEKKMVVEEIIEKTEYSYTVENDTQERKTTEQSAFQSHPAALLLQSQEHKQHENGESPLIKVSNSDASDLIMENLVFAVELANKKHGQDHPHNPKTAPMVVAQFETADRSNEQEGGERVSTESSSESMAIQTEMRKSPSFHFELLAEGSTEDSDQTPLLYHDKTVNSSLSRGAGVNSQYLAMAKDEESLKLEKSDSNKSRTPFLSFLKEEEEARLVASQENQDTVIAEKESAKEVWDSTSPKRRTKRRSKSSLFSNCICCATAIS